MRTDITATLKRALTQLQAQRGRIDRQIAAIEAVLRAGAGTPRSRRAPKAEKPTKRKSTRKGRRPFTVEEKAAARARMKAYWEKRKTSEGKGD